MGYLQLPATNVFEKAILVALFGSWESVYLASIEAMKLDTATTKAGETTYSEAIANLMRQDPDILTLNDALIPHGEKPLTTGFEERFKYIIAYLKRQTPKISNDTIVPRRSLEDTQSLLSCIITRLDGKNHQIAFHKLQQSTHTE
jgi:hypothetical protein